ncbi:hypothetical protein [Brevundimonas sp. NPDC058933]|uniref:hypothetical protein n=1 Tax=Brevundimonas sp. NPDC058933 TaxID=3346673 RepID=UPI003BEEB464
MKINLALLVMLFGLSGCASHPPVASSPSVDIHRELSCEYAYGGLSFLEGSSTITANSSVMLSLVVEASQRCSSGVIKIVGLSDKADDDLNRARVSALRDYMKLFGVTQYEFVAQAETPGKMELQWVGQSAR